MRMGIFCYNLEGVGPRNRAKNLIRGLGKYTDYQVDVVTHSRLDFTFDNIHTYVIHNCKSLINVKKIFENVDIVHVPVNFYQALLVRKLYSGPIILGAGIQHGRIYRMLTRRLISPSYIIETHSDVNKLWIKDGFNSTFIYPSVDIDIFRPYDKDTIEKIKNKLNIPLDSKLILYVGRLEKFKGADIFYKLIKIASNRKNLFFVVVGDGELRYLFDRGRDNLLYVGFVKNDNLPMYYNISDVTIVPSISESFSFVSLESAACGTPVVTTAKGIIKKIFGEKNIYLWSDRNPLSILEKIEVLLDDHKLYRKQVKKALKFIKAKGLTLDIFVRRHVEVYKKATKEFNE